MKDRVLPSTRGTPMKSDNLPELTLHELRHTFASIMLHEWYVTAAMISEAMRHADIAFTFRVYGHLIESALGAVCTLSKRAR